MRGVDAYALLCDGVRACVHRLQSTLKCGIDCDALSHRLLLLFLLLYSCVYTVRMRSVYGCGCQPYCYGSNCGPDACGGFCGGPGLRGGCPRAQTCVYDPYGE